MDFVLTLVGSSRPISAGHIALLEKFFEDEGLLMTGEPTWLNPNKAVDIFLAECPNLDQMTKLRANLAEDRIDAFCTNAQTRKKTLLLADMDSTIVTSETLDELAEEADLKDKISEITERAMRGELDFHTAIKERVGLLKGLSTDALDRTLEKTEISKGADVLIKTMRKHGSFCVLVSGGFTFFTNAISKQLTFTQHHGNILNVEDGILTGTVSEPILDKEAKLRFLKLYCEELEIDISETVAIGDGANDLPMLKAADLGVGYHPKPILKEELINYIEFTDLRSLLYAQGYSSDSFVQ